MLVGVPGTAKATITMNCSKNNPDRRGGTVTVLGTSQFAINWDSQAWGGAVDSFRRVP